MPTSDDFISQLRMNNMFPSGNNMPYMNFQRPELDTRGIANLANSFIQNRNNAAAIQEDNLHRRARFEQLQDIGRQIAMQQGQQTGGPNGQPMNTVLGADPNAMSGYQKAQIALGKQRLAETSGTAANKAKLAEEQLTQKGKLGEEGLDVKRGAQTIQQQRANIYEFKAKHPNMKIEIDKGGNFVAIDPLTGKGMDTGIATGTMSEEEKQNLVGSQAMARTNAQQTGANERNAATIAGAGERNAASIKGRSDLAGEEHGYRTSEIEDKGIQTRATNYAKPNKGELPNQTRVRVANSARQLANSNPELAGFISYDEQGNPSIEAPSEGWFGHSGPTPAQYRTMLDTIYGSSDNTRPGIMVDGKPMGFEEYNRYQQTPSASSMSNTSTTPGEGARPGSTARPAIRSNYRVTVED